MAGKRIIFSGISGLFTGLLLLGVLLIASVDVDSYKAQLAEQMSALTGRQVSVTGSLDLQLSIHPVIRAEGLVVANAPWGSRAEMLKVKRVEVQLELLPLLSGDFRITRLDLLEPDLYLETDAHGRGNWLFNVDQNGTDNAEQVGRQAPLPMIRMALLESGNISYLDGQSGKMKNIRIDLLEAEADGYDNSVAVRMRGPISDRQVEWNGHLGSYRNLVNGDELAVDLQVSTQSATGRLQGVVHPAAWRESLKLKLDVSAGRMSDVLALWGVKGAPNDRAELVSALSHDDSGWFFEEATLQLDRYRLAGNMHLDAAGERLKLTGHIHKARMDLRDERDGKAGDKKIFSAEPLKLSALNMIDAEISLDNGRVIGSKYELNDLNLKASLKQGLLRVSPATANVGGGRLKATLNLDARRKHALVDLRATGHSLGLGEILDRAGHKGLLSGGASRLDLKLRGRGSSMARIMGSLSGTVLVDVGKGRMNNKVLDLAGGDVLSQLLVAVNPLAKKEPFTRLECAVANLSFKGGVAQYDKRLAAETDKMTLVSSGRIDLKRETLDMGMNPKPRKDSVDLGIGAGDLVSVARLQGSLAEPELGLDAANTAKTGFKVYTAIATGGASLLLNGLFDKVTADPHPCQTALGSAPAESRGAHKKKAPKKERAKGFPDHLAMILGE
ncbi:MAG: AsmA family protein [Sedimenticola sp.]